MPRFVAMDLSLGNTIKVCHTDFCLGIKKWEMVSYYPDLKYINYQESKLNPDKICLGYTGKVSEEKGIRNFFAMATALKRKRPEI